ncbi:alpha/beta fold hydrolase [Sulfobacillus harzensis]|uniref:Alpha/beta fold hydrolase n=1 Tax=Sulfobacillus harzensis TaxID=2729629 RepID=A0A7Y0L6G0_9FIRM|nr:alpha/beta fold hydrolase [Sulfobacillus harzensis]NMP23310.1 alpha/beta fold hydrolase [Sulfobacillus harzensis]
MNALSSNIWMGEAGEALAMIRRGVTRLVDLRAEASPPGYAVPVEHFPLQDEMAGQHAMLSQAARRVAELAQRGEVVGVYCQAGNSRTAAVAALALVHGGTDLQDALRAVRQARPSAVPALSLREAMVDLADGWNQQGLRHEHLKLGDLVLHAVHRPGLGRRLVLLHGVYGSWTHWQSVLSELPGVDVWLLDMPGFGESDDWPGSFDHRRYTEMLAQAVRRVAGAGAVLGGYSFGAYLALALLDRYPDLAPAAILVSLAGRVGDASRHWRVEERRFPPHPLFDERLAVVEANLRAIHFGQPDNISRKAVYSTYHNIWRTRLGPRRMREARSSRVPPLAALSRVTKPLLMVWGEHDPYCQPQVGDWAAACRRVRPDMKTRIVPGAAHWVQEERPQEVGGLIRAFVDGVKVPTKEGEEDGL